MESSRIKSRYRKLLHKVSNYINIINLSIEVGSIEYIENTIRQIRLIKDSSRFGIEFLKDINKYIIEEIGEEEVKKLSKIIFLYRDILELELDIEEEEDFKMKYIKTVLDIKVEKESEGVYKILSDDSSIELNTKDNKYLKIRDKRVYIVYE